MFMKLRIEEIHFFYKDDDEEMDLEDEDETLLKIDLEYSNGTNE